MSKYFDNKDMFLEPKTTQYGSHMVMTNVNKTTKTKYINIDTKFRDEYNYNKTINYNITLPQRINDVKNIHITSVEIPMTFYNIASSLGNNYFKITNNTTGNIEMVTLDDGQYNSTSLSAAINSKISQLSQANLDLKYYVDSNKSVFYSDSSTFTIDFAVDSTGEFDKYNFKSKLGWLLGFRNTTYTVTYAYDETPAPGTGPDGQPLYYSEHPINLLGTKYLYLAIDEFSSGNQNSFVSTLPTSMINKNIIARISLDRATHTYGTYFPANKMNGYLMSDNRSFTGKIDIQKLNVQLLDENGIPVDLNSYDFSFCMEVDHE